MRIPIAKEGLLYGVVPLVIGAIFLFFKFRITGMIFIIIAVSIFLFFRYPDRMVKDDLKLVYAPADGRVIQIDEGYEDTFFKDIVRRVGIFMSIFNVHINYAPISGMVECVQYTPGRFRMANLVGLKEDNENNFIGISNDSVRVGVRQVAGWIARRIVCDCKAGDTVSAGRRLGLIKFGSRVDVYLPKNFTICVKIGDKVRAGRTILSEKGIVIT